MILIYPKEKNIRVRYNAPNFELQVKTSVWYFFTKWSVIATSLRLDDLSKEYESFLNKD